MTEETNEQGELELRESDEQQPDRSKSAPADRAENGPFDSKEVPSMRPYVDMGGIKVPPREGLQLRLDVDEQAKRIVAVSLDIQGSTLQVQAFSAPKSSGLWREVTEAMQEQLGRQGVAFEVAEGVLGPEVLTTVQLPEHRGGGQTRVRIIGVDGPRWLLRGTITGNAVADPEAGALIEQLFRDLVVVRGEQPMPPNELIPLKMPAGLQAQQ